MSLAQGTNFNPNAGRGQSPYRGVSIFSRLDYDFLITGNSNLSIPVDIELYLQALTYYSHSDGYQSLAVADAEFYIDNKSVAAATSHACEQANPTTCGQLVKSNGHLTYNFVSNRVYRIELYTGVGVQGFGYATALADPKFSLSQIYRRKSRLFDCAQSVCDERNRKRSRTYRMGAHDRRFRLRRSSDAPFGRRLRLDIDRLMAV